MVPSPQGLGNTKPSHQLRSSSTPSSSTHAQGSRYEVDPGNLVSLRPAQIHRFWRGLPTNLDSVDAVYERPLSAELCLMVVQVNSRRRGEKIVLVPPQSKKEEEDNDEVIYTVLRHNRTRVQWQILLRHAIHLDDVAKKENSSTQQFVHSFPLSEPAGWLSRYIYIPTVEQYQECLLKRWFYRLLSVVLTLFSVAVVWGKCTFFTFFSTRPVLSLIVIQLADRGYNYQYIEQDNDPKHTAKVIRNYLQCKEEQEVLEVMVRPPQSSDLNIIECVWDYMKRRKGLRKPVSTENLWTRCLNLLGFQQFMEDSEMTSDLMDEGKELNRQAGQQNRDSSSESATTSPAPSD